MGGNDTIGDMTADDKTIIGHKEHGESKDNTPKRNNKGGNKGLIIIAVVLVILFIVTGTCVGILLSNKQEPEPTPNPNKPVAEVEDPIVGMDRFDYGEWTDLNDYFDYEAIGMLDRERFCFRTTELCVNKHNWLASKLDSTETIAYVYATPVLCIRSQAYSTDQRTILNGLKFGTRLMILERLPNNWAKVQYIKGETEGPVNGTLIGYVSMEYLTNEKTYNIMKRHVLPTLDDEARFSVSKWRRAAADIIYIAGATFYGPKVNVTIENVKEISRNQESVVVFGLTREDSDIKLLAFVEFYAGDNEYRILGIIPGERVADGDIAFYNTGDYHIKYSTTKSIKR